MSDSKIRISLESVDPFILHASLEKIVSAVFSTNAKISGPIPLPTKRKIFTVLRSPHANKKARDQFKEEICKRLVDINNPDSTTVDALIKFELPKGVEVKLDLINVKG